MHAAVVRALVETTKLHVIMKVTVEQKRPLNTSCVIMCQVLSSDAITVIYVYVCFSVLFSLCRFRGRLEGCDLSMLLSFLYSFPFRLLCPLHLK